MFSRELSIPPRLVQNGKKEDNTHVLKVRRIQARCVSSVDASRRAGLLELLSKSLHLTTPYYAISLPAKVPSTPLLLVTPTSLNYFCCTVSRTPWQCYLFLFFIASIGDGRSMYQAIPATTLNPIAGCDSHAAPFQRTIQPFERCFA